MKRSTITIAVLLLVVFDVLLAVYVFNYTTETLEPEVDDIGGITVLDAPATGITTMGTEDGRVITPFGTYQSDAEITSLLAADDGHLVAFADDMNRVNLFFTTMGSLLWTRAFDEPVQVVDMWTREGPFLPEATHVLVEYDGGFSLLQGTDGATAWSFSSDEPFAMQSTENGKIIVGSGSTVSYFWLGAPQAYRFLSVEGPVEALVTDAGGISLLMIGPSEAILYDGITGDVRWRRNLDAPTQAAMSRDGEKSYLLSGGHLEVISLSGQQLSSSRVGEGQLLAPAASSYYFILRGEGIDAYYEGRPAPVWRASIGSPYAAHSTPGGTVILAWNPDKLLTLDNTNPSLASKPWVGVYVSVIVAQLFLPLFLLLTTYPLPRIGDVAASLLIGALTGLGALLTGALETFVELGVEGALVAAFAASAAAALVGRKAGSPGAGIAIGLAVGVIGFLAASLLVDFYRYVFEISPTFQPVAVAIRSLILGWLLGLLGGVLGGLSSYITPDLLRSVLRRT